MKKNQMNSRLSISQINELQEEDKLGSSNKDSYSPMKCSQNENYIKESKNSSSQSNSVYSDSSQIDSQLLKEMSGEEQEIINKVKQNLRNSYLKIRNIHTDFTNKIKSIINSEKEDIELVKKELLDKKNMIFFKKELQKEDILISLLIQDKILTLKLLLENSNNFYKFNDNFIFEYLANQLKEENIDKKINEISQVIYNVVNLNLYNKDKTPIFGWLIICFGLFDEFKLLVDNNSNEGDYYYNIKKAFNDFSDIDDMKSYASIQENYEYILKRCLNDNLEDIAINILNNKGELSSLEVIYIAIKKKSLKFIKFVWDNCNVASQMKKDIINKKKIKLNQNESNMSLSYSNLGNNMQPFTQSKKSKPLLYSMKNDNKIFPEENQVKIYKNNYNINNQQNSNNQFINNNPLPKFLTFMDLDKVNRLFNKGHKVFDLGELIQNICQKTSSDGFTKEKKIEIIDEIVSTWDHLDKTNGLFEVLFNNRLFDQISILYQRYPNNSIWKISTQSFVSIIRNFGIQLIEICLKEYNCIKKLEDKNIQEFIIYHYLTEGDKIYYGAEMLSYIKILAFDLNLVIPLLNTIEESVKEKKFLLCHSPILASLLLFELITAISDLSSHFSYRCNKTKKKLLKLCNKIYKSNPSEKYIKFLLDQNDFKGRSAYQIASKFGAYEILESAEVGTIVNRMWNGRLSYDGVLDFSSLYHFIENPFQESGIPFISFDAFNNSKTYFHEMELWQESCYLRYYPEALSTIILIIIYNLFIYFLVINKKIMTKTNDLDVGLKFMLFTYIVWNICIVCNIPLQILYGKLTGRSKYEMDIQGIIEICMMFSGLAILIDTESLFPNYDENGNIIPSEMKGDFAFMLRATILSINDIFVWLRITDILFTYNQLGPLIRMIYLLSIEVGKYLIVYLIIMIACATIFTTLFYKSSQNYETYSITFTTLFQGYINNGNSFEFENYKTFGAIMCVGFMTIGGLVLINILIAHLSNEYNKLLKIVDASQRSIIIEYYRKYKWNKKYGYMIFLTTPLNILNILVIPLNYILSLTDSWKKTEKDKINNQIKFNYIVCKVYYSCCYFPVVILMYSFSNLLFTPICYCIGLFSSFYDYFSLHQKSFMFCLGSSFLWLITGIPVILFNFVKDLYNVFNTVFKKEDVKSFDVQYFKIKKEFSVQDIKKFIYFIHSRDKKIKNSIHSILLHFIDYEINLETEKDKIFRDKIEYIKTLLTSGKKRISSYYLILNTMYYKHLSEMNKDKQETDNQFITSPKAKRNLIIIGILENFLIANDSEFSIVDIEKIKILLPKFMKFNNSFYKRLLFTNTTHLNTIFYKKKNADEFMQHKLLNKFEASIVRLDKIVDGELYEDPIFQGDKNVTKTIDLEKNEDDFYQNLESIIKKMLDDAKENIKRLHKQIDNEEKRGSINL